jgi:hypothetical protein
MIVSSTSSPLRQAASVVKSIASRPARSAALILVGLAGTMLYGLSASAALSPRALYQALLQKSFQPGELLSRSPLIAPTAGKLGPVANRYHALGEVNASFNDAQDGIAYIVYPTVTAAHAAWLAARPPGVVKASTSGLPNPVRVSTKRVTVRAASGKTTVNTAARVSFPYRDVVVSSYARSTSKTRSILTAVALAQAALHHQRNIK